MRRPVARTRHAARLLVFAAAVTMAAACGGSDASSGPSASPVGSYSLSSLNSKPLPFTLFADTGFTIALSAGSLNLTTDGSYLATTSTSETIEGHVSIYVDSASGRWTQAGATLLFVGADNSKQSASFDGTRLSLTDSTSSPRLVYVFTKR
jgi:hypothetical protein